MLCVLGLRLMGGAVARRAAGNMGTGGIAHNMGARGAK